MSTHTQKIDPSFKQPHSRTAIGGVILTPDEVRRLKRETARG